MTADDPIALCLAGRISPEVAIARLVLSGMSAGEIARRLATPPPGPLPHGEGERAGQSPLPLREGVGGGAAAPAAAALARLLAERRDGIDRLARTLGEFGFDHAARAAAPDTLARIRAAFDRAVACSPEASVAAYSLGEAAILDAATAELVDWLAAQQLIGADADVLDLGCGIGRVAAALAPRCRSVLGIDIAPGMIAEARRRHAAPNLRFAPSNGRDLSGAGDARFDLVLAVDSFPYVIQAGADIAEQHVADAARLLRSGGALTILNLSYRGGPGSDRADAAHWAVDHGFEIVVDGASPFAIWDGTAFVLRKASKTDHQPRSAAASASSRTTSSSEVCLKSR